MHVYTCSDWRISDVVSYVTGESSNMLAMSCILSSKSKETT